MFYNGREVLSDHFQLILFWIPESSFCKKKRENGIKWEFFPQGGGAIHSHFYAKKHNFFSQTWGSKNGARGREVPDLGKIPTFSHFFLADVPNDEDSWTRCLWWRWLKVQPSEGLTNCVNENFVGLSIADRPWIVCLRAHRTFRNCTISVVCGPEYEW